MTNEEIMEIIDNDDAWDTGALGRDENFARLVKLTPEREAAIDEAVGLQLVFPAGVGMSRRYLTG